jgi:tricorn protease
VNPPSAFSLSARSCLHQFVRNGDFQFTRHPGGRSSIASLGARLCYSGELGGWEIKHIYRADPQQPLSLSPLVRAGSGFDIREADVITAINHRPVVSASGATEEAQVWGSHAQGPEHPASLLQGQVGKQVLLTLRRKKDPAEQYQAVVTPISIGSERNLRFSAWQYARRSQVEDASKGRVGYVHLRAMGGANMSEFAEMFYPVFDREGLVSTTYTTYTRAW